MPFQLPLFGADGQAPAGTATAGTVINAVVPPLKGAYTRLLSILYTVGTTAHALTVLREAGRTTVSSAAAAAQAVVNITADPGAAPKGPNGVTSQLAANVIAANDWVVIELPDGTFWLAKVSSVSTLAITMTANVPTGGISAGAVFWWFGVAADTNPLDPLAGAHPKFSVPAAASATTQYSLGNIVGEDIGGLCRSTAQYSPMIIQSNNATVAGTIEHYSYGYSDR